MDSVGRLIKCLLPALWLCGGCAHGPDVGSTLPLRRVVIYRNGVAYYERAGNVDTDEVSFRVRASKVGDFLATLAVMEAGGSSVRSASFPIDVEKDANARANDDKLQRVRLTLDGEEHDLSVGYVAETPLWRPSYRIVVAETQGEKHVELQAWGIVQNLSGEDWKDVSLSLVAGAPIAFQSTLDKPVMPERPIVTDEGEVITSVPTGETSLAGNALPNAAPSEDQAGGEALSERLTTAEAAPPKKSEEKQRKAAPRGGGGVQPAPPPPAARPMPVAPSAPRDVRSLAVQASEGATTRYDLPFPVEVPDKTATMVLLVSKKLPGSLVHLFAPDGGVPDSASHPFRVARFANTTMGLLERGPIAVFDRGSFVGQGLLDPLPKAATATVPFAIDRSIGVESSRSNHEEGARLARIEAMEIDVERDVSFVTSYKLKNGGDEDVKLLVRHPRLYDTRLQNPPKGTEENTGTMTALIPVAIPKHSDSSLSVDERRTERQRVGLESPLFEEALFHYIRDPRADAAVVPALTQALSVTRALRSTRDELRRLELERDALTKQSDDVRRNLRAIEKNAGADTLRKELTSRLSAAAARLSEITKLLVASEMAASENEVRLRELVRSVRLLKPLPPG